MSIAFSALLVHPPIQGRKAIEEFQDYVADPYFVPATSHIQGTFYDRVRRVTRRNIALVAVKYSLLELESRGAAEIAASDYADRMAEAVRALALRDRELVAACFRAIAPRFEPIEGQKLIRALARFSDQDYFWEAIPTALVDRLNEQITRITSSVAVGDPLPREAESCLSLARFQIAREHLPALKSGFESLPLAHQISVMNARPDEYYVPHLLPLVKEASTFRMGEQAGESVVLHAPYLGVCDLEQILTAWANNSQCRLAVRMPYLALELFRGTEHLGARRVPVFAEFVNNVMALVDPDEEYYNYPGLAAELKSAADPTTQGVQRP